MAKEKRQSPSTLLWFIRHKSYVPISEIRRRFHVETEDGAFIDGGNHRRVYVGLPIGTAQSIEKLWRQGKIGLELSCEFDASVLIGVYPMVPAKEYMNGHSDFYPRQPVGPVPEMEPDLDADFVPDMEPDLDADFVPEIEVEPRETATS